MIYSHTGAIILTISILPSLLALGISVLGFKKHRYPHFLSMSISWLFIFLSIIFLSYAYWSLNILVYILAILITIPIGFSISWLIDTVSRVDMDVYKIIILTFFSTLMLVFAFDEQAISINISKMNEVAPSLNGYFMLSGAIIFLLYSSLWFYYNTKIYYKSPSNIKKYALLSLIGATMSGPIASLSFATGLVWLFPGIDYMFVSMGVFLSSYSFWKEPKLGYVLPFKVYAVISVDLISGIPLYSYEWNKIDELNIILFSGAIRGLFDLMGESIGKGQVEEIKLKDAAIQIYNQSEHNVGFLLISSNVSKVLKIGLKAFAEEFCFVFRKEINDDRYFVSQFDKADKIILEKFPFVPHKHYSH